jgi:hypothetical protein
MQTYRLHQDRDGLVSICFKRIIRPEGISHALDATLGTTVFYRVGNEEHCRFTLLSASHCHKSLKEKYAGWAQFEHPAHRSRPRGWVPFHGCDLV